MGATGRDLGPDRSHGPADRRNECPVDSGSQLIAFRQFGLCRQPHPARDRQESGAGRRPARPSGHQRTAGQGRRRLDRAVQSRSGCSRSERRLPQRRSGEPAAIQTSRRDHAGPGRVLGRRTGRRASGVSFRAGFLRRDSLSDRRDQYDDAQTGSRDGRSALRSDPGGDDLRAVSRWVRGSAPSDGPHRGAAQRPTVRTRHRHQRDHVPAPHC